MNKQLLVGMVLAIVMGIGYRYVTPPAPVSETKVSAKRVKNKTPNAKEKISEEEQAFLDSGRAKAIAEDETIEQAFARPLGTILDYESIDALKNGADAHLIGKYDDIAAYAKICTQESSLESKKRCFNALAHYADTISKGMDKNQAFEQSKILFEQDS